MNSGQFLGVLGDIGELGKITTKALLLILELIELLVLLETVARDMTPVMPNATKHWHALFLIEVLGELRVLRSRVKY